MAQRERALSDLSRVRVLAEASSPQSGGASDCSARETLRHIIEVAKSSGLYIDRKDLPKLGELVSKRTGESAVYFNEGERAYYKVKSPIAKDAIKHTTPADWFYEHIIHNILFPNAAYSFVGVSEEVGELRIILKQPEIESDHFPSDAQIAAHLASLGLSPEDRFFFGNDVLAVTDIGAHSDNVLLGTDNQLYFIDPLIRLKMPAKEVIDWLVGKK